MTFYCYCSATIKLLTTPASAVGGFYLVRERERASEREKTQRQQIEHIATVIHRKIINLTVKLLF